MKGESFFKLGSNFSNQLSFVVAFRKYSKIVQIYFSLPLLLTRNSKSFDGGYSLKKYNC